METPSKKQISVVEETDLGVYVWRMPDGRWIGDDEGNFLSIAARKGDLRRVQMLSDAVRSYGIDEGSAYFLPGRRKINDEEYEEQNIRLQQGLIPDQYDIPALLEEMKNRGKNR